MLSRADIVFHIVSDHGSTEEVASLESVFVSLEKTFGSSVVVSFGLSAVASFGLLAMMISLVKMLSSVSW